MVPDGDKNDGNEKDDCGDGVDFWSDAAAEAAIRESFRLGSVMSQNVRQGVAPRSREASSWRRSIFCRPAQRSVVATEMSAVPWPRKIVTRLRSRLTRTAKRSRESPVMMPGRMSGRRTRRRKSDLPGKSLRSRASAASKPRVRESATAPAATIRLLKTESQMAESEKSWRYQSSVK